MMVLASGSKCTGLNQLRISCLGQPKNLLSPVRFTNPLASIAYTTAEHISKQIAVEVSYL